MEPTQIHQTIAYQIDNQRPPHLVPGRHVGMEVTGPLSVRVTVVPTGLRAIVTYNEGSDLYELAITTHAGETTLYDGVYCDMLGDLIFGVDAEAASFPMVGLIILDPETGDVTEERLL
jgi:hypothetical protein